MRQFAGFGTPEETNERYKTLLAAGGTGLSVAFDLPTLMGRDPDHELSLGEVGKCGVSIVSLADMERLFDGHLARRHHDVDDDQLAGADDLRDVSGRRREAGRGLEDALGHDPERHPQGVHRAEGVHLSAARRRCGSSPTSSRSARRRCRAGTRSRSAAITSARPARRRCRSWPSRCATASSTCSTAIDAGLDVDDFAPRISFFFNSHSDFFEEIAKFRAARKIWAEVMRDRFGAQARALVEAAVPHADRRRVADRAAALQQRRPHGAAGAGGRARRHASRSTRTRSTRRWRCRPPRPRRSRCARSRSSRTRAA